MSYADYTRHRPDQPEESLDDLSILDAVRKLLGHAAVSGFAECNYEGFPLTAYAGSRPGDVIEIWELRKRIKELEHPAPQTG